jgi:hypothetical protein
MLSLPVLAEDLQTSIETSEIPQNESIQEKHSKIVVPQFSEFAPPKYINAKPNSEALTAVERVFSKLFIISILGIPIGLLMDEHVYLREKNNKWADRRFNFENSVKYCAALDTKKEIESCYKKLRKVELYKNADKKTGNLKLQSGF